MNLFDSPFDGGFGHCPFFIEASGGIMAFVLDFHYDPDKNWDDLFSEKGFQWGTFDLNDKKYKLLFIKSALILKSCGKDNTDEKIIFQQPYFLDPTKKHTLAVTHDDNIFSFYLDSKIIENKFPVECI